ncbi:MAG TPA: hypothetical protein PK306_08115 [Aquabacterium sp.]|nr:hypothetical protein [Aquabacterium sp.]HQC95657.1 hypothetical protein [Aquabacterium sp.]
MRSISERDLAVVIPLLAAKIRDFTLQLRESEDQDLDDAALDQRMDLQEMLQQYQEVLQALREEYEQGLADGIRLPAYDALVEPFQLG